MIKVLDTSMFSSIDFYRTWNIRVVEVKKIYLQTEGY